MVGYTFRARQGLKRAWEYQRCTNDDAEAAICPTEGIILFTLQGVGVQSALK